MHLVELHAQIGNAGAGFFAAFEVQQKSIAVGLYGTQLVQVGIAAVVDDAAVADQRGGLVQHITFEQRRAAFGWLQITKNIGQKCR